MDFFHLDAAFFPQTTRDLFPVETILRDGVLPLGIKNSFWLFRTRRILNVGFLSPNKEMCRKIEALARSREKGLSGIRPFRIGKREFLSVLASVYEIPESKLKRLGVADVHQSLRHD